MHLGKSLLFLLLFVFLFSFTIDAQVRLRFDRGSKTKSFYYDAGDILTFRLKGSKEEYNLPITQILPESNVVVFPKLGTVRIDDITAIRLKRDRKWPKAVTSNLYGFGTGWILFSLVDMAYDGNATWASTFGIAGIAALLGWLVKWLFRPKKYKLGKRNFLRIVNLGNFFQP